MALTAREAQDIRDIITREGGIDKAFEAIRDSYASARQTAATAALSGVSMQVSDWAAVDAFVETVPGDVLYRFLNACGAAITARNADALARALMGLYAAEKAHRK